MPNVLAVAEKLHLTRIIQRAISFHPELEPAIWSIPVRYNPRLSNRAGQCHYNPLAIDLHVAFLGPKTSQQEHVETFLHELAHAMEFVALRTRGHGPSWWMMMHQLGQVPRRTHNIAACTSRLGRKADGNPEDMGL